MQDPDKNGGKITRIPETERTLKVHCTSVIDTDSTTKIIFEGVPRLTSCTGKPSADGAHTIDSARFHFHRKHEVCKHPMINLLRCTKSTSAFLSRGSPRIPLVTTLAAAPLLLHHCDIHYTYIPLRPALVFTTPPFNPFLCVTQFSPTTTRCSVACARYSSHTSVSLEYQALYQCNRVCSLDHPLQLDDYCVGSVLSIVIIS